MDLRFASPAARKQFTCATCPQQRKDVRRCAEDSYRVLTKAIEVEKGWGGYRFCPGKATWSEEVTSLFDTCRVALETGILPRGGSLEDQDEVFTEVFPAFVAHWRERNYDRVWTDVRSFTKAVLESVLGKKGATKGKRG